MDLFVEPVAAPKVPTVHNIPSILRVNWLYLASMLLIISVGASLQNASFSWGLLATEFLLILLPTLLVLRLERLPLTETLRLHWPGWRVMGLALAAGVGVWLVSTTLESFTMLIFGYAPSTAPDTYPVSIGQAVLVFMAFAISAPLCEEAMFRGTIQAAYERRGRRQALIITSLMFAFFHLRLQGLVALLPVAFMLGYLRLRANSLWPAVAAHMSNNAMAAILLIFAGLQPDWLTRVSLGSSWLFFVGLAVVLVALWLFARLTTGSGVATTVPVTTNHETSRLPWQAVLPLGIAALLYLVWGRMEFVHGRMPELTATDPLTLDVLELEQKTEWEYDIRNVLDESVGQASCTLTPTNADYVLDCQTDVRAFKVELPGSTFQANDHSTQLTVQWQGSDLNLIAGEQQFMSVDSSSFWRLEPTTSGLNLVSDAPGTPQALTLPDGALLPDEWPWRFMALPFAMGLGQKANFAWPALWQQETQTSAPAVAEMAVIVYGAEPITVPAGKYIAWRVQLGNWTAWYDVKAPHTLLRYDAGFAFFVLKAVR